MAEKQCKQLWPGRSLGATTIRLQTYAKQPLAVLGSLDVQVVYEQQKVTLPLIIVEGNGPTLFGRNWFNVIKLNWPNIHYTRAPGFQDLLHKYSGLFEPGLGAFKGPDVSIEVDPEATPRFCKARML